MRSISRPVRIASLRQRCSSFSSPDSSDASFFRGCRETPGIIPLTSQLDWPISITTTSVLSWFRAARDRLRSFNCSMAHSIGLFEAPKVAHLRRSPHSIFTPGSDGLSRREAAKWFGVHRNTVTKMLSFSVPPGYRRRERPASKKLGPYIAWIDAILEGDSQVHKKQRHTAYRIFERLRDEQGFTGGYTIVREHVAAARLQAREMFVPLSHRPGHGQADFGEADGYIGGKKVRFHYFCMDLPHSDGCFVKAYPAETAEAFCDGHLAAFDFFSGVPQSILYDNTKLAVAKIVKGGRRLRSKMFAELQSHYLFEDRFGRPGKGNDKGKVEGLVGYVRRNFMTPLPVAESFDAFNVRLLDACTKRRQAVLRGHRTTIAERMQADLAAFIKLPPAPYDACDCSPGRLPSVPT
jgi:transposase